MKPDEVLQQSCSPIDTYTTSNDMLYIILQQTNGLL
jgi:hypothetical protein